MAHPTPALSQWGEEAREDARPTTRRPWFMGGAVVLNGKILAPLERLNVLVFTQGSARKLASSWATFRPSLTGLKGSAGASPYRVSFRWDFKMASPKS